MASLGDHPNRQLPAMDAVARSGANAVSLTGARVEALEVTAYKVPTDSTESDGTLEWDSTTIVVVEALTDGGAITGLGYTYAPAAAVSLVESELRDLVLGSPVIGPPIAWSRMRAKLRNAGQPGLGAMALSAVDVALWDLRARLLGLSLADSLGRFRDGVPVYGSGGFTSYGDDRLAEQLRGWADDGLAAVKMKVGRDPACDPARLDAARDAIGLEVELMVDANGAFGVTEAIEWANSYADWDVVWFEEPVTSDDHAGLSRVRDRAPSGMQIAAGEYAWGLRDLDLLAGSVDVLQADVTRCGGITALLRADGICRARQVRLSAHCAPQVSAHAFSALESALHLEYFHDHVRIEKLLFEGALQPESGTLRPDPSSLGLGLALNGEAAAEYRV